MLLDIKYALRLLLKTPKFTALSLLVLIGGLSISLLIFSVLYAFVYKPLPVEDGESILFVDVFQQNLPAYEFLQIRDSLNTFAESGVWESKEMRFSYNLVGRSLNTGYVESSMFKFARTQALLGRTLQPQDSQAGAPRVAVISYRTWQTVFNGSQSVLNSVVKVEQQDTVIVGVMPDGFNFPISEDVWLPLGHQKLNPKANSNSSFRAYARLKSDVDIAQGNAELSERLNALYQRNVKLYDKPEVIFQGDLMSFPEMQNRTGTMTFIFFNLTSIFILLLACNNVGNFLLSRALSRQKETAVRSALGARSSRLVMQLMWEGIIITTVGAIISLIFVHFALDYLNILLQSNLASRIAFWSVLEMGLPTIIAAVVFTILMVFLATFLPSWRAANQNLNDAMRDGSKGSQGQKAGRMSRILMLFQVSLISTLMFLGSQAGYVALMSFDYKTGYELTNLNQGAYRLPKNKYSEDSERLTFAKEMVSRLTQQPSIPQALVNFYYNKLPVAIDGADYANEKSKPQIEVSSLIGSPQVLGVKLLSGRYIDSRDNKNSRNTAVISQSMANRYWPGENVLERQVEISINNKATKFYIVGVVSDVYNGANIFDDLDRFDEIYISGLKFVAPGTSIYFKTNGNTEQAHNAFYSALYVMDKDAEVHYIESMQNKIDTVLGYVVTGSKGILFAGFFSLLMALVGIYGLTANNVVQRTMEIGIRRALGCRDEDLIKLMLMQASKQLVIGIGIGLSLFAIMSFLFNSFTEASIPVYTYFMVSIVVTAILGGIVMLAIYIPTKRAVELEPAVAFHYE